MEDEKRAGFSFEKAGNCNEWTELFSMTEIKREIDMKRITEEFDNGIQYSNNFVWWIGQPSIPNVDPSHAAKIQDWTFGEQKSNSSNNKIWHWE